MLPGYFESQALVTWASVLGGGHLELPSSIKPNGMLVNPQKEFSVIRMEKVDVGTCSIYNDNIDDYTH